MCTGSPIFFLGYGIPYYFQLAIFVVFPHTALSAIAANLFSGPFRSIYRYFNLRLSLR